MNSNEKTIQSYEGHIAEYITGTPQEVSGVVKEWIDESIADIPKDVRILELGSATGRDAAYLQDLGYAVECSDATEAFVDLLTQKGFNARKLNMITDDFNGSYDFIFANAVLLHLTRAEMAQTLGKISNALGERGRFAFTLKQGEDEGWSESKLGAPRFFYWTEGQIGSYLEQAGFGDVKISGDKSTANATWLQIIAQKNG
jgi:SAM-dependent methyltransferase